MSKTLGQIAYEGFNTFKGNALCWPLANGHAVEEMAAWEAAANAIIEECAKIADEMAKYLEDWNERNVVVALMEAADKIRALKSPENDAGEATP